MNGMALQVNENDICLICYESLIDDMFIEFEHCSHRFCHECLQALVFQCLLSPLQCPFDRQVVNTIFKLNADGTHMEATSIKNYRKSFIITMLPSVIIEVEEVLGENIVEAILEYRNNCSRPRIDGHRSIGRINSKPRKELSVPIRNIIDYISQNNFTDESLDRSILKLFRHFMKFLVSFQKSFETSVSISNLKS